MNELSRICSILTYIFLSTFCFSQKQDDLRTYTALVNGEELVIKLLSDSTYESKMIYRTSYGYYEIISDDKNTTYDNIIFGDIVYDTKDAYHSYNISISEETVNSLVDSNTYNKDSSYVAICDITGEYLTFYNVCFTNKNNELLYCDYNEKSKKTHIIPPGTCKIGIIGEQFNYVSYFKSEYNRTQGSIVYVIGPSSGRFLIRKDRSRIVYRPCYCDGYDSDCCISFINDSANVSSYNTK